MFKGALLCLVPTDTAEQHSESANLKVFYLYPLLLCLELQSSNCRFKLRLLFYGNLTSEWLLSSFSGKLEEINSDSFSYDFMNIWGLSHSPLVFRPAWWQQHKTKSLQLEVFF